MRILSNNNRFPVSLALLPSCTLSPSLSRSLFLLRKNRVAPPRYRATYCARERPDRRRDIKRRVYLFRESVINHVRPAPLISPSPFPRSFLRFPGACFRFVSLNAPALYVPVSTLSSVPRFRDRPSLSFSFSLSHPFGLRLLAQTSVGVSLSSLQIFPPHLVDSCRSASCSTSVWLPFCGLRLMIL